MSVVVCTMQLPNCMYLFVSPISWTDFTDFLTIFQICVLNIFSVRYVR